SGGADDSDNGDDDDSNVESVAMVVAMNLVQSTACDNNGGLDDGWNDVSFRNDVISSVSGDWMTTRVVLIMEVVGYSIF
ncbi:hypothetical protein U1Q18_020223, partial [Sarracenia purpurea var. burkii]